MADRQVSTERVIAAPPETIFAVLADPAQHPVIDGSGTLQQTRGDAPARLALGSRFGMNLRNGVPYFVKNTVVEFDENRRIAWQTRGPGKLGAKFGGRIWRYELEPVDGGTLVRESWDVSQEKSKGMTKRFAAGKTGKNMEATLARIEQLVT